MDANTELTEEQHAWFDEHVETLAVNLCADFDERVRDLVSEGKTQAAFQAALDNREHWEIEGLQTAAFLVAAYASGGWDQALETLAAMLDGSGWANPALEFRADELLDDEGDPVYLLMHLTPLSVNAIFGLLWIVMSVIREAQLAGVEPTQSGRLMQRYRRDGVSLGAADGGFVGQFVPDVGQYVADPHE